MELKMFEPITIGDLKLKNRIVMAPMATNFDITSPRGVSYYMRRAKGGVGLIIVEGTSIDNFSSMAFVDDLIPLVDGVHKEGAKIAIQLVVGNETPEGERLAPSATGDAREITIEEIEDIHARSGIAALRAEAVGFDAAEIHGAHGHFISRFFSPRTNRRTDRYGGSRGNRMRFALECVKAVRKATGYDFPIFYRFSADEFTTGGVTIEDSKQFAIALEQAGVAVIDVSAGATSAYTSPGPSKEMGTYAELAGEIKQVVNIPVIAVGRINTSEVAEKILREGKADLIAIGRQLIADPDWPRKIAEGKEDDVVPCLSENKECLAKLSMGLPINCTQNDKVGFEYLELDDFPYIQRSKEA